jgi:hypothetical protein
MKSVNEKDISQICIKLLSDCYLTISFNSIPLSVTLLFISNVERKKVVVVCNKISKFSIEKDAEEEPFYTVLDTKIEQVNDEWVVNLLPEIEMTIVCKSLSMAIEKMTDQDLVRYGLA